MKPPLELDSLDALVVELLIQLEKSPRSAPSRLLADLFREQRLKPRQQKRIKDLFWGVLNRERLVDRAILAAAPGGSVGRHLRQPVRLLTARVLSGDLSPKGAVRVIPWVDWSAVAGVVDEVRALDDEVQRDALLGSLPAWVVERLQHQYADQASALIEAMTGTPPVTLRTNPLRAERDAVAARLLEEDGIPTVSTEHARHGLRVTAPARVFATGAWRDGWFEMQDEASQLVAEVVAPPPAGKVLDACAGAGGKTLALAGLLGGRGEILAIDSHAGRLNDLRKRARRAGAHAYRAVRVAEDAWPESVEEFARRADRILVDAPCSGLGSLRRNPDVRWHLDETAWRRLQSVQRELVARAARYLQPGARLVYATCTVLREENEAAIEALLEGQPELEVVPVAEVLGGERGRPLSIDGSGRFLQLLPNRQGCDGFFAAVVRRPRV